jgi:hypothetical protein
MHIPTLANLFIRLTHLLYTPASREEKNFVRWGEVAMAILPLTRVYGWTG